MREVGLQDGNNGGVAHLDRGVVPAVRLDGGVVRVARLDRGVVLVVSHVEGVALVVCLEGGVALVVHPEVGVAPVGHLEGGVVEGVALVPQHDEPVDDRECGLCHCTHRVGKAKDVDGGMEAADQVATPLCPFHHL